MKFSLLYKTPEKGEVFDLTYDLSIDRVIRSIITDPRRADYFLGVMMKPCVDRGNIVYRQQLLQDFLAQPRLYDDLKVVFNRYDKVKSDWQEMRNGTYNGSGGVNRHALLEYTFASLKVTAMFPKTIASFFGSISETIARYDVKSDALNDMRRWCDQILSNDSMGELERIAALFQYKTADDFEYDVMVDLDGEMRLIGCDLCDIAPVAEKQNENVFTRLFGSKKKAEASTVPIPDDEATVDDALYISNEALKRIDAALTDVTGSVYEVFYGLSGEMQFYDAAIELAAYLKANDLPTVFPDVLEETADCFDYRGLIDLKLVTEGLTIDRIVPHDISLSADREGMLIKGRNNSGKTTLLRSIGMSQVFAQAGLPVCAASAAVSLRRGLYSHFSSAEEDFKAGDTAGRFEGEVQIVARIIDGVESRPYSLILFNETFQTTSYAEGAEGMWQILDALPLVKAKYVFVSRLNRLFELADPERVDLLEMGEHFAVLHSAGHASAVPAEVQSPDARPAPDAAGTLPDGSKT